MVDIYTELGYHQVMKVLFLDLDGVMNSVGSMIYNNRMKMRKLITTPTHRSFCPVSSSNLQYILEEVKDIKIVITSTWRKYNSLKELKDIFKSNSITASIIGMTPVSDAGYRGAEIESYLKDHPEIKRFVILDDDTDMNPHKNRLVKTDGRNGLTFSDAERVIEMLGGKIEENEEN